MCLYDEKSEWYVTADQPGSAAATSKMSFIDSFESFTRVSADNARFGKLLQQWLLNEYNFDFFGPGLG